MSSVAITRTELDSAGLRAAAAGSPDPYDVFWFEEPVMPDDYDGHRKLAAATSIPIVTGENEYTRYGFRDLIRQDCATILNADAKILGGVTEFMKVAALAQAHDLDIAPHGSQDIHIRLVAAISNGFILEFYATPSTRCGGASPARR